MHAFFELHIEQGPILEDEDKRDRRRHPRPGPVVAAGHADRQGSAYRLDADARCAAMPGSAWRASSNWSHEIAMDYQPDAVGAVGQMEVYPNSRNVIAGHGGLHRRHPLAGQGSARRHGRAHPRRQSPTICADARHLASRSSRSAISTRSPSTRTASRPCAMPPSGSATRTATSSRAPATTPAGSTASRRRRW